MIVKPAASNIQFRVMLANREIGSQHENGGNKYDRELTSCREARILSESGSSSAKAGFASKAGVLTNRSNREYGEQSLIGEWGILGNPGNPH